MSHEPRLSLSHEESEVERALDVLGERERAGAPAGLEARIAGATAPMLRGVVRHEGGDEAVRGLRMGAHARAPRRASHVRLRWAVAAGLGATVCVAAWLAMRGAGGSGAVTPDRPIASGSGVGTGSAGEPAPGGTSMVASAGDAEAEVEAMFLASSLLDTGFDSEIDAIATSAASLGLTLTDPLSGLSETTWGQGVSEGNSL